MFIHIAWRMVYGLDAHNTRCSHLFESLPILSPHYHSTKLMVYCLDAHNTRCSHLFESLPTLSFFVSFLIIRLVMLFLWWLKLFLLIFNIAVAAWWSSCVESLNTPVVTCSIPTQSHSTAISISAVACLPRLDMLWCLYRLELGFLPIWFPTL